MAKGTHNVTQFRLELQTFSRLPIIALERRSAPSLPHADTGLLHAAPGQQPLYGSAHPDQPDTKTLGVETQVSTPSTLRSFVAVPVAVPGAYSA